MFVVIIIRFMIQFTPLRRSKITVIIMVIIEFHSHMCSKFNYSRIRRGFGYLEKFSLVKLYVTQSEIITNSRQYNII